MKKSLRKAEEGTPEPLTPAIIRELIRTHPIQVELAWRKLEGRGRYLSSAVKKGGGGQYSSHDTVQEAERSVIAWIQQNHAHEERRQLVQYLLEDAQHREEVRLGEYMNGYGENTRPRKTLQQLRAMKKKIQERIRKEESGS